MRDVSESSEYEESANDTSLCVTECVSCKNRVKLKISLPSNTVPCYSYEVTITITDRTRLYTGLALCIVKWGYIGTGLALYKNIRSTAIHRASPVYSW